MIGNQRFKKLPKFHGAPRLNLNLRGSTTFERYNALPLRYAICSCYDSGKGYDVTSSKPPVATMSWNVPANFYIASCFCALIFPVDLIDLILRLLGPRGNQDFRFKIYIDEGCCG